MRTRWLPLTLGALSLASNLSCAGPRAKSSTPAVPNPATNQSAESNAQTPSSDTNNPAPKPTAASQTPQLDSEWVKANFQKQQVRIPMRDGVELFTTIYSPKSGDGPFPILFQRTPYSTGPYEADEYRGYIGPNPHLARSGYIIVYQDVRGCFMSGGKFENMRPHLANKPQERVDPKLIDESTDTYDTIDWLVKNVPNNNGRVGMWGISYPGFYASAGMINAHPALKAVSPQAPIADWWFDDFHHHGAFFLPHAFNFLASFGQICDGKTKEWPKRFDHQTPDGYAFFQRLGPLSNANSRYFHDKIAFWNTIAAHPNRDEFWQSRDILPHLKNTAPAVMTVGGWFDAEDLYGPLKTYASIEKNNPGIFNVLVMGPWDHGGWAGPKGESLGNIHFGQSTSQYYQKEIETPFFDQHLKASSSTVLPEAKVFDTGAKAWRSFPTWPPKTKPVSIYFSEQGKLENEQPKSRRAFDEFVSDPKNPVPFTEDIRTGMTRTYMTDDQRFAARRPDVLVYQTDVLDRPLAVAGEIGVDLWVSTSQGDADWIVKLIDVLPPSTPNQSPARDQSVALGEYQMMVRSEVFRGRFREDYAKPKRFTPNRATRVRFPLQDVLHTFEPGHRLMIQVQSTWFPLVDINPQSWVDNIFEAKDKDFVSAKHRVYRDAKHPSHITVSVLAGP